MSSDAIHVCLDSIRFQLIFCSQHQRQLHPDCGQPQLHCFVWCLYLIMKTRSKDLQQCVNRDTTVKLMTKTCLKSLRTQMLNVTMFHHLNTTRWDLHINQPRGESCIKHVCCISRMNLNRSDFKLPERPLFFSFNFPWLFSDLKCFSLTLICQQYSKN